MAAKKTITHEGLTYYSQSEAARQLGTTATKIRGLMGDGTLEWKQLKVNGPLYIVGKSLIQEKQKRVIEKQKKQ